MRKLYTFGLSILLFSCLSETSVDPGSSATFIRYFNGGNNDEAKAMEVVMAADGTVEGFIILATTRIQKAEADIPRTKIKIVKTDAAGNPLWQQLYPAFTADSLDYTGSAIQINPAGGYVIIGDVIDSKTQSDFPGVSRALVLTVDNDGLNPDTLSVRFARGVAEKGRAIAVDGNGNFLALTTQGTDKMILTQINQSTLVPTDTISYSSGDTQLSNRLIIDDAGKALWSGKRTLNGLTGIRLLKVTPGNSATDFDQFYNEPGFSISGFDFCKLGLGYAIAGATNLKTGGTTPATDTDILYYQVDAAGNTLRSESFPFDNPATPDVNEDNQKDAGNSISSTLDGGLIFLSSVNSAAIQGRGESDFYLIKINAFGEKEWTSSFGSRFIDEGVTIRQLGDGSYVALGTTTQGSLKILTLFKTNSNGKID